MYVLHGFVFQGRFLFRNYFVADKVHIYSSNYIWTGYWIPALFFTISAYILKFNLCKNINFYISRLVIQNVTPYIIFRSGVVCSLEERGVRVFSKLSCLYKSTRKKNPNLSISIRFLLHILYFL